MNNNEEILTSQDLHDIEEMIRKNRVATERMYEIDQGVGGLGVAHPEMLDDWSAYQDAVSPDSDEPTLPEKLLGALAAERARADAAAADALDEEANRWDELHGMAWCSMVGRTLHRQAEKLRSASQGVAGE